MKRKDYITGVLFTTFFLFFLLYSNKLDENAAYWPRVISIVGIVLSVLSSVTSYLGSKKEEKSNFFMLNKLQSKRICILFITLIIWLFGIKFLGFLSSSSIIIAFIFVYFEPIKIKKNIYKNVGIALIFVVAMYTLFTTLGVKFPKGFLL